MGMNILLKIYYTYYSKESDTTLHSNWFFNFSFGFIQTAT